MDRSRLAAQLDDTLTRLGLERKVKELPAFEAYLAARERERI